MYETEESMVREGEMEIKNETKIATQCCRRDESIILKTSLLGLLVYSSQVSFCIKFLY